MFSVEQRMDWIEKVFNDDKKISVETYQGLTIDFCKEKGARFILRGLRTAADFEFERGIGQVNRKLDPSVETIFMLTEAQYTPVTSSIVRDVIRHGGKIDELVPTVVVNQKL